VPGEVLVDEGVTRTAPQLRVEAAGRRVLKGFAEPVRLWSLE
jgi:class 3 adenylate cyclase